MSGCQYITNQTHTTLIKRPLQSFNVKNSSGYYGYAALLARRENISVIDFCFEFSRTTSCYVIEVDQNKKM